MTCARAHGCASWASRCPAVAAPAGAYIPAVRTGSLVFTAGQVPFVDGRLAATGKVGAEVTPSEAKALARHLRAQRAGRGRRAGRPRRGRPGGEGRRVRGLRARVHRPARRDQRRLRAARRGLRRGRAARPVRRRRGRAAAGRTGRGRADRRGDVPCRVASRPREASRRARPATTCWSGSPAGCRTTCCGGCATGSPRAATLPSRAALPRELLRTGSGSPTRSATCWRVRRRVGGLAALLDAVLPLTRPDESRHPSRPDPGLDPAALSVLAVVRGHPGCVELRQAWRPAAARAAGRRWCGGDDRPWALAGTLQRVLRAHGDRTPCVEVLPAAREPHRLPPGRHHRVGPAVALPVPVGHGAW